MKQALLVTLFLSLSLAFLQSCGKRGALYFEGERQKPNFDNVSDEIENK